MTSQTSALSVRAEDPLSTHPIQVFKDHPTQLRATRPQLGRSIDLRSRKSAQIASHLFTSGIRWTTTAVVILVEDAVRVGIPVPNGQGVDVVRVPDVLRERVRVPVLPLLLVLRPLFFSFFSFPVFSGAVPANDLPFALFMYHAVLLQRLAAHLNFAIPTSLWSINADGSITQYYQPTVDRRKPLICITNRRKLRPEPH